MVLEARSFWGGNNSGLPNQSILKLRKIIKQMMEHKIEYKKKVI